tara:strand:+ start:716 stop:916 length:201 start_codon:yes stop_codon:yes gene_type:complete
MVLQGEEVVAEKSKEIMCEECDKEIAVIIDRKIYKCPDCYMLDHRIPIDSGLYRLNKEGKKDRKKN